MTDEEYRELDFEVADLRSENRVLRSRLESAIDEALRLRHKLEHIYALSNLSLTTVSQSERGLDAQGREAW
jgi:hypothetical protein